ncbi:carbonic anhydrase [Herbaspirillum sp. RTI4]|uniref:carbonic anhydrase n=1 Tax=Herbaspirillum sp. RTI4 TaxID=3048640 RepID=UPI002AB52A2D|nr:carbonic anhydrase [Herbaspirillum sp. RTI4]MDY7577501.1 carbonic anhydrase [Herbaspirillum sp. RTI4]MEA9980976.1 carbonic anhydrase [Herbaspirillum sp. RTI4]
MSHQKLMLAKNVAWAADMIRRDADFFTRISKIQNPETLWIGCADSRVPAEKITVSLPGELFVHRNIANLVCTDDTNAASVIEYAVKVLKVRHIVVCGHYGCGGVRAALMPLDPDLPAVNRHLQPLRELAARHATTLLSCDSFDARVDRFAEINVQHQLTALRRMPVIRTAEQALTLHGWIFSLEDGRLQVLPQDSAPTQPIAAIKFA